MKTLRSVNIASLVIKSLRVEIRAKFHEQSGKEVEKPSNLVRSRVRIPHNYLCNE